MCQERYIRLIVGGESPKNGEFFHCTEPYFLVFVLQLVHNNVIESCWHICIEIFELLDNVEVFTWFVHKRPQCVYDLLISFKILI